MNRPRCSDAGAGAAAAAAAIVVDRLVGDPPDAVHPVAWFGAAMARLERVVWRDQRAAGALHLAVGVLGATVVGQVVSAVAVRLLRLRRLAWSLSTFAAATVVVGAGGLDRAAARLECALAAGDLEGARGELRWLVGRDPSRLDEAGISRAVVESVAENTVDAVVAPALWAAAGGAAGAAAYRAANTLDAMVGHRSPRYGRFGWAAARFDDLCNLVPARAAAALVAAVRPSRAGEVRRTVRRDAPSHPSPNAGVIEAAFAAALGVQLGGPNAYGGRVDERPVLGDGRPAQPSDIARARRLARDVDLALAAVLAAPAIVRTALRWRVASRRGRP